MAKEGMKRWRQRYKRWNQSESAERFEDWMGAVVAPFFVAGLAYITFLVATDLPSAIRGSQGLGIQGTFTAESEDCYRSCSWVGTFVGIDGSVIKDTRIQEGVSAVGESVAAVDAGSDGAVYPADGNYDWLWAPLSLLLCIVVLLISATWAVVSVINLRMGPLDLKASRPKAKVGRRRRNKRKRHRY